MVTADDVQDYASSLPSDAITLELLTPMRLIEAGQLVRPLRFDALVRRLCDRIDSQSRHYGFGANPPNRSIPYAQTEGIRMTHDWTQWIDLETHSSRTNRWSPTGGFIGRITFAGDLTPFLPLLVWGTLLHVGKSATRGNGFYRIVPSEEVSS